MLYRAHLAAGLGLGVVLATGAHITGAAPGAEDVAAVAGAATVFALLPDLDTASIVQRWFYRAMLGVLVWMMVTGRAEHAAFLGAVSLLPLVHRHRGWMHAWWAALAVPLAALLLWDGYWIALGPRGPGFGDTLAGLRAEVIARWSQAQGPRAPIALAMVAGYALHLAVDFHAPRWLRWGRLV
jgi:hypothetical protein